MNKTKGDQKGTLHVKSLKYLSNIERLKYYG